MKNTTDILDELRNFSGSDHDFVQAVKKIKNVGMTMIDDEKSVFEFALDRGITENGLLEGLLRHCIENCNNQVQAEDALFDVVDFLNDYCQFTEVYTLPSDLFAEVLFKSEFEGKDEAIDAFFDSTHFGYLLASMQVRAMMESRQPSAKFIDNLIISAEEGNNGSQGNVIMDVMSANPEHFFRIISDQNIDTSIALPWSTDSDFKDEAPLFEQILMSGSKESMAIALKSNISLAGYPEFLDDYETNGLDDFEDKIGMINSHIAKLECDSVIREFSLKPK